MDTETIIARLVRDARPVRRLNDPLTRAGLWLLFSLAGVVVSVLIMGLRSDLGVMLGEPRYVVEQVAALLTAAATALAAFAVVVPGRSRAVLLLPAAPVAVWLGSIAVGCIADIRAGGAGFESDWSCFPAIALVGAAPALAMVIMLQRGAPLRPYLAIGFGALAAAAIGDFGLRLFHTIDAGLMVLVWQIGSVAVLTLMAALLAPKLLRWRHAA